MRIMIVDCTLFEVVLNESKSIKWKMTNSQTFNRKPVQIYLRIEISLNIKIMEDLRKDKREKAFFSLPSFDFVKRQREEYLVSLRKKNRNNKFNANRNLRLQLYSLELMLDRDLDFNCFALEWSMKIYDSSLYLS